MAITHTICDIVVAFLGLHQCRIYIARLSAPGKTLPAETEEASPATRQLGAHRTVFAVIALPSCESVGEIERGQLILMLFVVGSSVLGSGHDFARLVDVVGQLLFLLLLLLIRNLAVRLGLVGPIVW